jgi:hypothetical protein
MTETLDDSFVPQKEGWRKLVEICRAEPDHVDPRSGSGLACLYVVPAGASPTQIRGLSYNELDYDMPEQVEPCCVVGKWIAAFDGDLDGLWGNRDYARVAVQKAGLRTTDTMYAALRTAQRLQDRAFRWGELPELTLTAIGMYLRRKRETGGEFDVDTMEALV